MVGLDRRLHEKALDFRVGVEFDRNHNYRVCFMGSVLAARDDVPLLLGTNSCFNCCCSSAAICILMRTSARFLQQVRCLYRFHRGEISANRLGKTDKVSIFNHPVVGALIGREADRYLNQSLLFFRAVCTSGGSLSTTITLFYCFLFNCNRVCLCIATCIQLWHYLFTT